MGAATRRERTRRNHSFPSNGRPLSGNQETPLLTDTRLESRAPNVEISSSAQANFSTKSGSISHEIVSSFDPATTRKRLYANRNSLTRLATILSIATLTIVAIAAIRNNPETPTTNTQPVRREQTQASVASSTIVPGKIEKGGKIALQPLKGEFGFELGSAETTIPAQPITRSKEPVSIPAPEATPSLKPPAVAEAPQPSPPPQPSPEPAPTKKEFQEIGVEVRIEDGHVIEAQVKNRQPGAEPFEATAIHIARQRRYAPGTSRTETVVVRVANQLGRNAQ